MTKDAFKALRDELSLSPNERASMRAYLEAHMESPQTELMVRPVPSVIFPPALFLRQSAFAFAALLLIVSGGGIAAAEGALPGETLYGVKLGVNERFERLAAVGTVAKAEVDIRHAEERIREVELLSAKGETDVRAVSDITETIDGHLALASDAAKQLAKEGDEADADRVSARIDSALSAHAEVLVAQAENEDEEGRRKLRALSVALSVAAKEHVPEEKDTAAQDEAYFERIAASREEEAEQGFVAFKEALLNEGIPEESVAELSLERDLIAAELEVARMEKEEGRNKSAAEAYEELGKRAYRAYTLITSAKRVADETDKEVYVSLGTDAPEAAAVEDTAVEAMFLMTAPAVEEAPEENVRRMKDSDGPTLRFLIRERSGR